MTLVIGLFVIGDLRECHSAVEDGECDDVCGQVFCRSSGRPLGREFLKSVCGIGRHGGEIVCGYGGKLFPDGAERIGLLGDAVGGGLIVEGAELLYVVVDGFGGVAVAD